jgi:hypothetical protein
VIEGQESADRGDGTSGDTPGQALATRAARRDAPGVQRRSRLAARGTT